MEKPSVCVLLAAEAKDDPESNEVRELLARAGIVFKEVTPKTPFYEGRRTPQVIVRQGVLRDLRSIRSWIRNIERNNSM